ncbi:MAG: pyridoxal phosphate-dependent aminotransferase [Candidatus Omnitrophica bacterium]|nr:pyridoxal phosphate-dependent aminotransferase [Candidatus Omnitrophota bacterium]
MEILNQFNSHVTALSKSPTLKITALAKKLKKEGKDIINFAAGEPDFDTPDFIKQAAKDALDQGFTKYTPSSGAPELKAGIVEKLQNENSLGYTPENILVTTGAKFSVFLGIFALIEKDSEIILPEPYWVSYPEMAKIAGAKVRTLPTHRENGFKIDPKKLAAAITARSKLIILNYPSNPTGVTYTESELKALWDVIKDSNLWVLSDEIYEHILFDKRTHTSFAALNKEAYNRTITVNGFSKCFSMTGWRLGYIAAPVKFVQEASKMIDHTTSGANSIAQKAACVALAKGQEWTGHIKKIFQERRDLLFESLSGHPSLSPLKPQGTFYLFCDISQSGLSAYDFASRLLDTHSVAVIPSEGFGIEGYIRISFATSTEQIKEGARRIKEFMDNL